MTFKSLILAGVATVALSFGAQAGVVFSDNFDTEGLGLNYTAFANFNVLPGTSVDMIGQSGFFDFYSGNGRYVDLDGSTGGNNPAGAIATKSTFGPGTYTLTFNLGGSARGNDTNTVRVALGGFSQDYTLAANAGFTSQSVNFTTATGGALSFTNLGRSDNIGLILDNVQLASGVPEPSTWAMMLIGFFGLGAVSMRRRKALAAV